MTAETGKQLIKDMINRTMSVQGSWGKHVSNSCCKCQKCNCGKHKCEIKSPHLGLSPSQSTYNHEYQKRKPLVSAPKKQSRYESYEPRRLIDKTQYRDDYIDKLQESPKRTIEIHHDNIATGGPTFNDTTYQRSYKAGYSEPTSQIKNPENLSCPPGTKMIGNSNYRETYKWHPKTYKREKPIKRSDNLKTEISMFVSKSRYSTDFQEFGNYKRDKSNFAPDKSFKPEKSIRLETSYNDHYSAKPIERCPAENQP